MGRGGLKHSRGYWRHGITSVSLVALWCQLGRRTFRGGVNWDVAPLGRREGEGGGKGLQLGRRALSLSLSL